ncbi:hypothetical protein [Phaeacidiphilus oryzae]|uniref:hypothetical protein n=1 Tax=Phaeacidiphilus oryzae TaxID=348818 RepID=UPI00055D414D|nr:hypothetical protein [Phaeacidiphilus oryzae]
MSGGEIAGLVLLLIVIAVVAAVAVAVVKVKQAVQRQVEQHGANARRAVEEAALKARSFTRPGPRGQAASLRSELRASLFAARRVLESAAPGDPQLADSVKLLDRLEEHARVVDDDLRDVERRPGAESADRIPALRERVRRIVGSATALRTAAQDRRSRWADEELGRLDEEIAAEAGALRHWIPVDDRQQRPRDEAATHSGGPGAGRDGRAGDGRAGDDGVPDGGGERRQALGGAPAGWLSAAEELGLGRFVRRRGDRPQTPGQQQT